MHEVVTGLPDRLVVPLDGTDFALRAIAFADAWATTLGAGLELVASPHTIDRDACTVEPCWLAEATRGLRAPVVTTRYLDTNDPVAAITAVANERAANCLCMATHEHGPIVGSALGHVAAQVVRRLHVPAMLIGPECKTFRDGPVLVCHDGSRAANAILDVASAWADALRAPIELVHAMHPLDVEGGRAAPREVTRAAIRFGVKPMVCRGRTSATALLDAVADLRPSIIALVTHGRSGASRPALGPVATRLIHSSPCPALVVRPSACDLVEV